MTGCVKFLLYLYERKYIWEFFQIDFSEIMYRSIGGNIIFTSNWSPDKIFALTGELGQVQYGKKTISDFPPCGKTVVFVSEFVIFLKPSK